MGMSVIVPESYAYVIERLGKYIKTLRTGLHVLIPFFDRVAYTHCLMEKAIPIPNLEAITTDNVTISVDGVVFMMIVDPVLASYAAENPIYAFTQLIEAIIRNEIGSLTLDEAIRGTEILTERIARITNEAAMQWGIRCIRYSIKDISPQASIAMLMEIEAAQERRKRAMILAAEGEKQAMILTSEAAKWDQLNRATGDAKAILVRSEAVAESIVIVAEALKNAAGIEAAKFNLAELSVEVFGKIAKEAAIVLLEKSLSDQADQADMTDG